MGKCFQELKEAVNVIGEPCPFPTMPTSVTKEQEKGQGLLPHIWSLEIPIVLWFGFNLMLSWPAHLCPSSLWTRTLSWEMQIRATLSTKVDRREVLIPCLERKWESIAITNSKLVPETWGNLPDLKHLLPTLNPFFYKKSSSYFPALFSAIWWQAEILLLCLARV